MELKTEPGIFKLQGNLSAKMETSGPFVSGSFLMNVEGIKTMSTYWVATVGIVSMGLIVLFFRSKRFHGSRTGQSVRSEWLFAATTSGTVLVLIGAAIMNLLPKVTVIDIAALGVTGVLTGYSLALGLSASSRQSQNP